MGGGGKPVNLIETLMTRIKADQRRPDPLLSVLISIIRVSIIV